MAEYEKIARAEDIPNLGRLSIIVDDRPVLLLRVDDAFYAIEDVCTHDGQPLTDGPLEEKEIVCPRHGAKFDITTGEPTCMPATEPIEVFDVKVENGDVFVRPKN